MNKALKIPGEITKQVQEYNYLRSYICTEGECYDETDHHIDMAKGAPKSLQQIWKSHNIMIYTKSHVIETLVFPIFSMPLSHGQ